MQPSPSIRTGVDKAAQMTSVTAISFSLTFVGVSLALLAGVPAARETAWSDEEFQATAPESWIQASRESFNIGQPDWNPPVIPVAEVRDAYGQAIVAALQGNDVQQALDRAAQEMNQIVSRTSAGQ